ncbi:MAG: hypothetical protein EAZ89_13285 [Bacteroidetes bacterium]|nr:MAG: hypothetical protein EAZ89_13285 [Bacteroidota bacterium]
MFVPDPSPEKIFDAASAYAQGRTITILIAEEDAPDLSQLWQMLCDAGISFFGGIFPGIIVKGQCYQRGVVLSCWELSEPVCVVEQLSSGLPFIPVWDQPTGPTALILADGLSSNITFFLSRLYNRLGTSVRYIGAGAGLLSMERKPCLFCNQGVYADAALVAFSSRQLRLGVRHGWQRVSGPYVATRTSQNVIYELNWEKAFDVYARAIRQDSGVEIQQDDFFKDSKSYPFGIYREGSESIVRDPIIAREDGSIVCVGEVPENTVMELLRGDPDQLAEAAREAMRDCLNQRREPLLQVWVVACISRSLYLEGQGDRELRVLKEELALHGLEAPLMGVLSLGEISSPSEGWLEFYNKTIVVAFAYE